MASGGNVEPFFHGKGCRLAESGMRMPTDLAVAERDKEGDVVGQRDAHAQRHRGDLGGSRCRLDLGDETPRQPPAATIRQHGEPAEIDLLVEDLVKDAADRPPPVEGNNPTLVAKPCRARRTAPSHPDLAYRPGFPAQVACTSPTRPRYFGLPHNGDASVVFPEIVDTNWRARPGCKPARTWPSPLPENEGIDLLAGTIR